MPLKEELEQNGNWLFRRRSWLPILLFPYAILLIFFCMEAYPKITDLKWSLLCLLVSMLGILIRAITIGFTPKGTSGRNTGSQVADRLNQTGMYSIVRHPLYLGNFLIWLGLFIYLGIWQLVLINCLIFWIYYERIMLAEEEFLRRKYGSSYVEWASRTPAFFPKFSLWVSADLDFSFRNVLKREYNGVFALAVSFALLNGITHFIHLEDFKVNRIWLIFLGIGLALFLLLRFLKRKTTLLDVEGR